MTRLSTFLLRRIGLLGSRCDPQLQQLDTFATSFKLNSRGNQK